MPVLPPALIAVGFGNGVLLTPLLNAVLSRIGPSEVGVASGVLSTGQQVGGALGVAVIGVLFLQALETGAADRQHYAHALATAVILNLVIAASVTSPCFYSRPRNAGPAARSEVSRLRPNDSDSYSHFIVELIRE